MSKHQPTVFNQILGLVKHHLPVFVGQLDKLGRKFNAKSHFTTMLYAQASGKQSLRDIETGLQANESKHYHLGLNSVARSTISYRNNKTNYTIYENLFYQVYGVYKSSFMGKGCDLSIPTIAFDSTTISVSLKLFERAKYKTTKGGIKLHTGIDLSTMLPKFVHITEANTADNNAAKVSLENGLISKGEMIVFDRYYVDFELRKTINIKEAFFVTRTKSNTDYIPIHEYKITEEGITKDLMVELFGNQGRKKYQQKLRVVRFYQKEDKREYEYITNNFELSAGEVAKIYKSRREIEVFFRRIKQNLKIKSFLGTSENAVKSQIRIALIYYVLMKYLAETARLGKQQFLKLTRLVSEKCMVEISITELYNLCRGKSKIMSVISPPIGGLFSEF